MEILPRIPLSLRNFPYSKIYIAKKHHLTIQFFVIVPTFRAEFCDIGNEKPRPMPTIRLKDLPKMISVEIGEM